MLKHTDSESNTTPAARVRVTPEELVAAIAELQASKEGQTGTIAIGDAVHELSLDESPADILRTIEGQRAQQVRTQSKKRTTRIAVTVAAALMLVSAGVALRPHHVRPVPASPVSAAPAKLLSLNDVRDEQQVYVDTSGLEDIIQRTPAAAVMVFTNNNEGIRWGLIKHKGKVYLQAYTHQTTEKGLMINAVDIRNSEDHYGSHHKGFYDEGTWYATVKVTIPVTAFQYQDAEDELEYAHMTVFDVLPDSHLWDGFEDRFAQ